MIPDPPAVGLFVVAALALLLVPGPAVLYVVARSIHGQSPRRRAGGMLRRSRHFVRTQRYVTGTVYVGLGVATAFAGSAEDS